MAYTFGLESGKGLPVTPTFPRQNRDSEAASYLQSEFRVQLNVT